LFRYSSIELPCVLIYQKCALFSIASRKVFENATRSKLTVVSHIAMFYGTVYISYFIDPWFGIETQILIYSACLSRLSTNL